MIKTKLIPRTPSAYDPPLLIKSLLAQSLKYEPQREIVYRDLFRYNYVELNRRVRKLANMLTDIGVKPGDTVAVLDWDSHRYLECFYAIPAIGAILHTINIRLSPAQILYTMNHAEDKVVIVHEDFLPILDAIKDQLTTVEKYILVSDKVYQNEKPNPTTSISFVGEFEEMINHKSDQYEFPDFDENTWATTFYTTGTTGNPKGVYFSHRQLYLHTLAVLMEISGMDAQGRFRSSDVYMPITPMFHVHAWGVPFVATLLGTKQVYPGKYEPEMLLKLLIKEQVTFSHCVPTILQMLVSSPAVKNFDLSKWKVIIGGSALNKALAKAALDLGIDVFAGYGMSETCPVMAMTYLNSERMKLSKDEQVEYRVKAGVIAPFVEIRLMDENGHFLPHDGKTVGEIVARSPWMTQGYFKEPEKSEELWKHNWLHTGDIASVTPDNFIQIADRAKDVIKTGGEWVSSLEVENILTQVEGVAEAAVIGLPDDKWGERPHA
ncbi:MAG TPA: long-chain fatty acid--CoA ligase, partial [Microscillaceae bacterium]|nr:long-chain fatty acid--CoA ligase [Microscillaceae bacterium]